MKFNNVIDTLRLGCRELFRTYEEAYAKQYRKSKCFFRYLVIHEIEDQLCILVEAEFADFQEFRELVRGIPGNYSDPGLKNPPEDASSYIREAEAAFLELLDRVQPDCAAPEIPYVRYLTGAERERVVARFRELWNYIPRKSWYPMDGQELREDWLFIHTDYLEAYLPRIEGLLGLPENHIYCYGEANRPGLDCMEMAELVGYNGFENACCDREFSWILFFSHEETVTFAGSILPQIREMLEPEKAHWNRWN